MAAAEYIWFEVTAVEGEYTYHDSVPAANVEAATELAKEIFPDADSLTVEPMRES